LIIALQPRQLLPIDLDDEELERLERLAGNQGRSVEEVISDAITHYLLRESDSLN
jgi:predicted transcriptional regulator